MTRLFIILLISALSLTSSNFHTSAQNPIPVPKSAQKSRPAPAHKPKPNPKPKNTFFRNGNKFTVGGVTFEMVPVKGDQFMMGSDDHDAQDNEKPAHKTTVGNFMIGKTEVTQALWQAVMGRNPSHFKGSDKPVGSISWNDCQTFLKKLNSITGLTFRLPTEAEWEYAAKGGNKSQGYKYSGSNDIDMVAWWGGNSHVAGSNDYFEPHPVATRKPNELGIYDMTGNVWEWTSEKWSDNYNSLRSGGSDGHQRVIRGGAYNNNELYERTSMRDANGESGANIDYGLRLAL